MVEEKINDSILKDVQFYTLTNEGDELIGKTGNTKIDAQIIRYKVCNCDKLNIQKLLGHLMKCYYQPILNHMAHKILQVVFMLCH